MSHDLIKDIRHYARLLSRLRHCPRDALDGMRLVYEEDERRCYGLGVSVFLLDAQTGIGLMTHVSRLGHDGHEDVYGRLVRSAVVVRSTNIGYIQEMQVITHSPFIRHGLNRDAFLPVFEWLKIARRQTFLDKMMSRHRWGRSHYNMIGDRDRLYEFSKEDCIRRMEVFDVGKTCQVAVNTASTLFSRLH